MCATGAPTFGLRKGFEGQLANVSPLLDNGDTFKEFQKIFKKNEVKMKTLSEKKLSELTKIYNSFVTYSGKYAKEFLNELDKHKDKLSHAEYEKILLLYKQSLFEVLKSLSISSSIFVRFNEDDDFFSMEDFPD